jgi:phage baseplate assembly protein W
MAIGIRFPFQESFEGGVFRYTKTTPEAIRTNLISLLTTKKKQRVMNNNLYSPLYDQIFEVWDEISEDKLKTELTSKINTYIPEITLEDLVFIFDEFSNVLTVKVVYGINTLGGTTDSVEIDVNVAQNPT